MASGGKSSPHFDGGAGRISASGRRQDGSRGSADDTQARLQQLEDYARRVRQTLSLLTSNSAALGLSATTTTTSSVSLEFGAVGRFNGTSSTTNHHGAPATPPPPPPLPPPRSGSTMAPGMPRRPLPPMPPPAVQQSQQQHQAFALGPVGHSSLIKIASLSALLPIPMQIPPTPLPSHRVNSSAVAAAVGAECRSGGQEAIYENLADLDLSFLEQSYADRPRSAQSRREFEDDLISSTSSLSQQRSQTPSHNVISSLEHNLESLKLDQAERSSILDRLSEIERGLERIENQFCPRSLSMHRLSSSSSPLPGGVGAAAASVRDRHQQVHHHPPVPRRMQNGGVHKRRVAGAGGGPKSGSSCRNGQARGGGYHSERDYERGYDDEFDGDDDDDDDGDCGGAGGKDNDEDESPPPPYSAQAPPSHSQPPPGYVGQPPRIASSPAHQRWGERLHHHPSSRQGSPSSSAGAVRPTLAGAAGVGSWGSHERVAGLWTTTHAIPQQGSSSSLSSQQLSKGSDLDCQSIVSFQSSGDVGPPVAVMSPPPPAQLMGGGPVTQLMSNSPSNGSPRNGPEPGPGATGACSGVGSPTSQTAASTPMGTKAEMVYHLLTLLGHQEPQHMSQTLLTMSQSPQNCPTMRHSGCLALLIQLIHGDQTVSKPPNWTARGLAAQALRNIVNAEQKIGNEQKGRREVRVLHMLEMIRDYAEKLLKMLASSSSVGASSHDSNNESQPGPAMATLMKLSFDEEHRHTMTGLGGLQAIAELLEVDHLAHGLVGGALAVPSLSTSSLNPVQSYSSGSSSDCQTQQQQQQQACVTLRRYAGMALTNLTFGDSTNKATLCSYRGFMLALVSQLQSCSEDLRQVTASVLRNLSWRADQNSKQILREVGSVSKLMTAAIEANRESTLKSILSALWNLSAHCSSNKAEICATPGALEFLVDTLTYDAPSKTLAVVENAGGILRNVSSHVAVRDDYRRVLRDRRCLEILLSHLRSPSLTIVSNACGTLWNLSARCPEDQAALWNLGAVQMLKSLVHSKHRMIAMGSSAALKNLMAARPPGMDSSIEGSLGLGSPMSDGGFGPAVPSASGVPRLQARKQKSTVESLANQNLSETCENIDASMLSPVSPGLPAFPQGTLDKMVFAWSSTNATADGAGSKTSNHMYQAWSTQHHQNHHAQNQHHPMTGMQRFFVPRSDSRDSVHSTRSDSFCERWNRHPVVDGGSGGTPNGMPQAIDLSCRARSQDPLSQYSVQDIGSVLNNNATAGSSVNGSGNNNNNMTETEFVARVSEISQSYAPKVDMEQCYSAAAMAAVARGHMVENLDDKHKDSDSVRSRKSQDSSTSSYKRKGGPGAAGTDACAGSGDDAAAKGSYAETDLDNPELPVDYSLIYAEEEETRGGGGSGSSGPGSGSGRSNDCGGKKTSPPGKGGKSSQQHYFDSPSFHDDAVRTYCTEGTPYSQTPYLISNAASLSDLTAAVEDREISTGAVSSRGRLSGDAIKFGAHGAGGTNAGGSAAKGEASKIEEKSLEKPKTYCVEGTPLQFSHASSLSSLTGAVSECGGGPTGGSGTPAVTARDKSGSPRGIGTGTTAAARNSHSGVLRRPEEIPGDASSASTAANRTSLGVDPRRQRDSLHLLSETSDLGTSDSAATLTADTGVEDALDDGAVTPSLTKGGKTVTFSAKEEETPLMFSRSSSFDSLSSTDQHSIRSSVVSDFSRRTSGVVSPSELPDSPGGTMPPSPNRLRPSQTSDAFLSASSNSRGDAAASATVGATSASAAVGSVKAAVSVSTSAVSPEGGRMTDKVAAMNPGSNGTGVARSRNRAASGGSKDARRKLDGNRLSGEGLDAFSDETRAYAVEGTPFQQSHATSLSSLVNFEDDIEEEDDDEMGSEDRRLVEQCVNSGIPKPKPKPPTKPAGIGGSKPVGVVEPTSKFMQKQPQIGNASSTAAAATARDTPLTIRHQENRVVPPSQLHQKQESPVIAKVEPQRRPLRDDPLTESPPEYVTVFATEGTPANISHAGSSGNLSILSFPSEAGFNPPQKSPRSASGVSKPHGIAHSPSSAGNASSESRIPVPHSSSLSPSTNSPPRPVCLSAGSDGVPTPSSSTPHATNANGEVRSTTRPDHTLAVTKKSLPNQQQKHTQKTAAAVPAAAVDDDEDDDDVLLQCIQSAMPKKKTGGSVGNSGSVGSLTGHSQNARSSSAGKDTFRHSSSVLAPRDREKSSSSRKSSASPSKTTRIGGESSSKSRRGPPTFVIPPPPPVGSNKQEALKRLRRASGGGHSMDRPEGSLVDDEAPLYENISEVMSERRHSGALFKNASSSATSSAPPPRSQSVSALGDDKAVGSSEDEDAESDLLQRCIQFGMPKSRSDLTDTKPFQRHRSEHSSSKRGKKSSSSDRKKSAESVATGGESVVKSQASGEVMSHSQIIRREAKTVVTAIIANRDSMVDSYASTTSTASENLMDSANPPAGLLMEDSVLGASMSESGNHKGLVLGSPTASRVRRPGVGLTASAIMTASSAGVGGVGNANSKYKRIMEASMSSSSAYLENAKPPFPEDMDHSMISIASITSEMAVSSAAMKSSVTSENMVDLYRTAAAAMTAVYAHATGSDGTAKPGERQSTTGADFVDNDESQSEMLADVKPPPDLVSSAMCDSLFGFSLSENHHPSPSVPVTSAVNTAAFGDHVEALNVSGVSGKHAVVDGDAAMSSPATSPTKSDGSKRSPKERRQQEKERYQTYTLAVHSPEANTPREADPTAPATTVLSSAPSLTSEPAPFDAEDPRRRSARKSRSGDKERYKTQTIERKVPHRPRSSPEGSSETDTRAGADKNKSYSTPAPSVAANQQNHHVPHHAVVSPSLVSNHPTSSASRAFSMDSLPDPASHQFEDDMLETDLDALEARDRQRQRHSSSGGGSGSVKARVVKPGEGASDAVVVDPADAEAAAKAVRGRRRPLYVPKTGTFTRSKPSPELAALKTRIPDASDSDSTVSVDSSTFTRSRSKTAATKTGAPAVPSSKSPDVSHRAHQPQRSPLIVRETKTTKLRKQTSSPSPSSTDLLRSSSNVSVASSADSHGKRTPKMDRKPPSLASPSSSVSSTSPRAVSKAASASAVPPSKIAMLWKRADESRESRELAARANTTASAAAVAPKPTAKPAVAPKKPLVSSHSQPIGAAACHPPPPVPVKPKIKLTQKIGRLIKGAKDSSSSKSAAAPAAKEFIYRRPSSKPSSFAASGAGGDDPAKTQSKEEEEEEESARVAFSKD